ncbi:MAG: YkgJ family cysteine cluster protein [Proteobacteria bacterium]|nr:YkgJ family cysteine cluster protein [Pseudomonadota bacterium]
MTDKTPPPQEGHTPGQADEYLRQRLEQAVQFIAQAIAEHGLSVPVLAYGMQQFAATTQTFPIPEDVQCQPGCAFCCHTRVSTSIPEVLIIAQQLQRNLDAPTLAQLKQQLRTRIDQGDPTRLEWWLENKIPCPFLGDDAGQLCAIYEIRPFTCRSHHSTSATSCAQGFEDRHAMDIPCYPKLQQATDLYSSAFMVALHNHGLHSPYVEFSSALDIALHNETATGRWLAGQDVFRAAQIS